MTNESPSHHGTVVHLLLWTFDPGLASKVHQPWQGKPSAVDSMNESELPAIACAQGINK